MALLLSRRESEVINIGSDIEIVVHRITGNRVKLGIKAPKDARIRRGELSSDQGCVPGESDSPTQ